MSRLPKTHLQVLGFLFGILLLAGSLGSLSSYFGTHTVENVSALPGDTYDAKLLKSAEKRRLRREKRLEQSGRVIRDVGRTYPMQTSALLTKNLGERFEVALETAYLSYPTLGIGAPVGKPSLTQWKSRNWRALEDQMQFGLLHGVVAYPHSPPIGGEGNIVIAGHSSAPTLNARGSPYQDVFASLPEAKIGDRIELRDTMGTPAIYEVIETHVVPATETSILLQDTKKSELTLFTCYPVGTTKERWVVRARLVEEERVAAR